MFEGAVAGVVNRLLGKYVQDLDTENLNVGIFSGDVTLTDLKLKPEALYELDLPIEVKLGTIGRVSVQIPWSALSSQPAVVRVSDVLMLAGPVTSAPPARRARLARAAKRLALHRLDSAAEPAPTRAIDHLLAAVMNNIQVYVTNVHIRYEDSVSSPDGPFAAGFCMQSLSVETTNSKWKPSVTPVNATTVYQMMRVEAVCAYWNPIATVLDEREVENITPIQYYNWKHQMITALDKFSMHREDFDFLVRPCGVRVKALVNRRGDARVPRLLLDGVLHDLALQLSRHQYSCILHAFSNATRKYHDLYPGKAVSEDLRGWWRYAYEATLEWRVRPYAWARVRAHRAAYRRYKEAYKALLSRPNDTELKLDLQKCEDHLPIDSVVIAREHAKIELAGSGSEVVQLVNSGGWWRVMSPSAATSSVWGQLASPERARLAQLVGFLDGPPHSDKSKKYIEHKMNVTVWNCSVTLLNRGKEILAVSLTQLMGSLQTRPAYKVSCRVERVTVDGITDSGELAGLVEARGEGAAGGCVLALDWDKSGGGDAHAHYALTCALQPIDIVYVEYAITELLNFFQTPSLNWSRLWSGADGNLPRLTNALRAGATRLLDRTVLVHLNLDAKGIALILPEYGCLTKGGHVLVVEASRVSVRSELQSADAALDDATSMELEERLYDRLHVHCAPQVTFGEAGGRWREARRLADSDLHLVPRVKAHLVFSNNIKKEYKLLPRYKLNVSLSSLKLNINEQTAEALLDYWCGLPAPAPRTPHPQPTLPPHLSKDTVPPHPSFKQLLRLTKLIVSAYLSRTKCSSPTVGSEPSSRTPLMGSISVGSVSEQSEEDLEILARAVDLPGFEDNVSPHNHIHTLLRLVIGEIVVNISESVDGVGRPYLMLVGSALSVEAALLTYGPALQISLGSVLLADKKHHDHNGHYLEIVSTDPAAEADLINILYRKVRADCPEFKSHFHSVEQSLVADVAPHTVLLHSSSLEDMHEFLQRFYDRVSGHAALLLAGGVVRRAVEAGGRFLRTDGDPPVPPGATKFSYSLRWWQICIRGVCGEVCGEVRLGGLDVACVFRANDRLTFSLTLATLHLDDFTPGTLYSKVIWPEEECVLELKYCLAAPRVYGGTPAQHLKADGQLKLTVGRIHYVCFCSFLTHLQHYAEAAVPMGVRGRVREGARRAGGRLGRLATSTTRINLVLQIHLPVLILPHKPTSPDLIVINMGDLTVENFFKPVCGADCPGGVVDNVLVQLSGVTVCRALVTLASTLQAEETILEPVCVRCDVKRVVGTARWTAAVACDCASVALAQRDIATILAVCNHNLAQFKYLGWWSWSGAEQAVDDVQQLQAFLAPGDDHANDISVRVSFEGLEVKLYRDAEEAGSSPVREAGRALALLRAGDAALAWRHAPDNSALITAELSTLEIHDIRPALHTLPTRIFHPVGGSGDSSGGIVVWRPALVSATCRCRAGAVALDLNVDTARLTLALPFLAVLTKTIVDALPSDDLPAGDCGLVNLGYVGDADPPSPPPPPSPKPEPALTDAASVGPAVSGRVLSLSVRWRRPEVLVLGSSAPLALLARAEIFLEYSTREHTKHMNLSLAGLEVLSRAQSCVRGSSCRSVMSRCDVELTRTLTRTALLVSPLHITLTPELYHTLVALSEEISSELALPEEEPSAGSREGALEDLWTPKKVSGGEADPPVEDEPPSPALTPIPHAFVLAPLTATLMCYMEVPSSLPLLYIQTRCELDLQDLGCGVRGSGSLSLEARVYDHLARTWQPLVEPVQDMGKLRPWELNLTLFQGRAHPISSRMEEAPLATCSRRRSRSRSRTRASGDDSGGSESDTLLIRADPRPARRPPRTPPDSDEDDTTVNANTDAATPHLFSDSSESSGDEASDGDDSSEPASDMEIVPSQPNSPQHAGECGSGRRGSKSAWSSSSSDSGVEAGGARCLHAVLRAPLPLALTLGEAGLHALTSLAAALNTTRPLPPPQVPTNPPLTLQNDIGPGSRVELRDENNQLVTAADYDAPHSRASSPGDDMSSADLLEDAADMESSAVREGSNSDDGFDEDWTVSEQSEGDPDVRPPPPHCAAPALPPRTLHITLKHCEPLIVRCPREACRKLHAVRGVRGERYFVVLERQHNLGAATILLRSPLQVQNETMYALEVWCGASGEGGGVPEGAGAHNPFRGARRLGLVPPHQPFHVPLRAAYTAPLYFQPAHENFGLSSEGVWWQEVAAEGEEARELVCPAKDEADPNVFAIGVIIQEGVQVYKASVPTPNLVLRLVAPLTVHNALPVAIELAAHTGGDLLEPASSRSEVWRVRLQAAERARTHRLHMHTPYVVTLTVFYQDAEWTGAFLLTPEMRDRSIRVRAESDSDADEVRVRARVTGAGGRRLAMYCPHWLMNRTELAVGVRAPRGQAVEAKPGAVTLWGARAGGRLQVRANGSSWSVASRLAPHASALVSCSHLERRTRYRLVVTARPAALCPALTTVVTLEPQLLVLNRTLKPLRYMELDEAADLWLELAPNCSHAFWPRTDSMRMLVKLRDSHLTSAPFPLDCEHTTVLRMDRGSALTVVVSGGTLGSRAVTLTPYRGGDAPLLVRNLTALTLRLHQPPAPHPALLPPRHQLLYTWDHPADDRTLLWNVYRSPGEGFPAHIHCDGYGEERVSLQCWRRATVAPAASVTMKLSSTLRRLAPAPQQDPESGEEGDGAAAPSRPIVYWVSYTEGAQRVVALTQDGREAARLRAHVAGRRASLELYLSLGGAQLSLCSPSQELLLISMIESAPRWEALVRSRWRRLGGWLGARLEGAHRAGRTSCRAGGVTADVSRLVMSAPVFAELRRAYAPAVWLHVRRGAGLAFWHARLHHLQVDDQLADATFPVALRPAAPPAGSAPRPFVELAALWRSQPAPALKYFKVLVQEFQVEVDRGLVTQLAELARRWTTEPGAPERLRSDLARMHSPPDCAPRPPLACLVRCDLLHVSPLKFSLSLSPRAAPPPAALPPDSPDATVLDHALHVWETATLDARDVVFRLSYVEVRSTWMWWGWVWRRAGGQWAGQGSQWGRARLTGTHVLGNRMAALGPRRGEPLRYYEPHQGSVAVGGVSQCRRALVLCAAAPRDGGATEGGGIPGGPPDTALLAAPPPPALAALLADRYTDDSATAQRVCRLGVAARGRGGGGAREALERGAAALRVPLVARRRLPRFIHHITGVGVYSGHCAAGAAVWGALGGRQAAHERYLAHAPLHDSGAALLLLTTRRVVVVRCGAEHSRAVWSAPLAALTRPPALSASQIVFTLAQEGAPHLAAGTRAVTAHCPRTLAWFAEEVSKAMTLLAEEGPLPARPQYSAHDTDTTISIIT